MMATETAQERSNEATVTSDEPTIKIDSDAQHVDSDQPHVNGDTVSAAPDDIENKQISDIVDDLVNSAEVSISGGSDNEASRSKLNPDEKGHGRTSSSVKKPASFKPVSVNKTFLAAKGASTSAPSKVADKSTASSTLASPAGTMSLTAARPRLVAKSGSGLVAKSSAGVNGTKGAAPDPNAVWNKNRPVPPPEPKKFTDEELKKYGIHMATRLHTDDTKGQANWADIDDDDDDWAPESITWKDGTKITIPHVEEQQQAPETPPAAPSPAPAPIQHIAVKEPEKPKSPAPSILATSKLSLPSGKGLILKGAPEKPTLVAKPPAPPAPVKSPWAPIPKVDKASPVIIDPVASQQGPPKFGAKDVPGPKTTTPPPTKEIAADDFSRTPWRDGPGAPNRELFNSQSGRYEPVAERRGSVRNDQHSRQPAAVLQRASQHDMQGPAEPSAAFQTSRVSEQHNPYGRRRGSSNVSGGSGSYLRLKGHDLPLAPPELLTARRESFTAVTDSPVSPIRNFSPTVQHPGQRPPQGHTWQQPHISPASTHSLPHHVSHPTEAAPTPGPQPSVPIAAPVVTEDDIALQKRLMHEKRELARKRRQEEEEREEAAKQERIRAKLAQMGPPPESRSAKMAATKDGGPSESQPQRDTSAPVSQKPAVIENKQPETAAASLVQPETKPEALVNGVSDHPQAPDQPSNDNNEVRSQQQGAPPVGGAGWPTAGPKKPEPFSHKNVWASPYPSSGRSLGNGTFTPELGRIPDAPLTVPGKHVPGPIAPPSTSRGTANVPTGPATRPAPIGPPRQMARQARGDPQRSHVANAWAAAVQMDDVATNQELLARRDQQAELLKAQNLELAEVQAPVKDTWRPTRLDNDGRRLNEKAKTVYHATKAPGWSKPAEPATQPQGQPSTSAASSSDYGQLPQVAASSADGSSGSILGTASSSASQQTRSSRFFPSRDVRQEAHAGSDNQGRSSSPSPPPPDMAGHPAFDGDVAHPHVSLPKPQPVVRLPPANAAPAPIAPPTQARPLGWASHTPYKQPDAALSPTAPPGQRTSSQTSTNNWQAKIDSLLDRKATSPPKSVPVVPATRSSVEHPHFAQSATVSLPLGLFKNLPSGNDHLPTTKDAAETCFEEQEMGSVPPVLLPRVVPEMAWHPCSAPKPMPKKLWPSVSSAEQLTFLADMTGTGNVVRVFMPGMAETKNIMVPFARSRSNPRRGRGGGGGGRHPSQSHRGGKGREPSASYSNDQSSLSGPAGTRGGRSGYPRRDNWSRPSGQAPIST